jgi:O-antigen/teichoic acid export membrane protein
MKKKKMILPKSKITLNKIFLFILVDLFCKGILFILIPFFKNNLSINDFNIYATNFLVIGLLSIFVGLGINAAILPFWKKEDLKREYNIYSAIISLFIFSFPIILVLSLVFSNLFLTSNFLLIVISSLLLVFFQILLLIARIKENLKIYSFLNLFHSFFIIIGSYLFIDELNYDTRIVISSTVIALLCFIIVVKYFSALKHIIGNISLKLNKIFFSYSFPVILFLLTSWLRSGYERVFAVKIVSSEELSDLLYSGQLATPILALGGAIIVNIGPNLHEIVRIGDVKKYYKINFSYIILAPFLAVLYVMCLKFIMPYLKLSIPQNTFAWILMTNSLILASFTGITSVYMYNKKLTKELAIIGLFNGLIILVVYYVLSLLNCSLLTYSIIYNITILLFLATILIFVKNRENKNKYH